MKRSTTIKLSLMGAAAVTLAACDGQPAKQAEVAYASPQQCIEAGIDASTCNSVYEKATEAHQAQAPRFKTVEDCQKDTDTDCQTSHVKNPDGTFSDVVLPMMAGYMLSNALNGNDRDRDRYSSGGYYGSPIYGSRSYRGSNRPLTTIRDVPSRIDSGYRYTPPARPSYQANTPSTPKTFSLPSPNVKTSTISRGGFGKFGGGFSAGS